MARFLGWAEDDDEAISLRFSSARRSNPREDLGVEDEDGLKTWRWRKMMHKTA